MRQLARRVDRLEARTGSHGRRLWVIAAEANYPGDPVAAAGCQPGSEDLVILLCAFAGHHPPKLLRCHPIRD